MMASLIRYIGMILLLTGLSACASPTHTAPDKNPDHWIGASREALETAWGPATLSKTLSDGSTQLQYVKRIQRPFPGPSENSPGVIVAGSKTIGYQVGTGEGGMSQYSVTCVTVFQTGTDGTITAAKQQGVGCRY